MTRLLPWALVLLLLGWWSLGVWPVVPVEGDDQGVIFGVESMLREDAVLRQARYLYEVQPGSYHVLALLARTTGAPVATIFGAATITGAVAFALVAARLLQIFLAWPLGWLLAALLWCQEITTAACYSNTSSLAAGFALAAVALAHRPARPAWIAAGLLLAFAGWLRADSLLLAPACLGLAYWRTRQWKPAMLSTAFVAVVALAVVLVLYRMSGTWPGETFATYTQRGYLLTGWRTLREIPLLLLSPALALGAIGGLLLLVGRRHYALLFVLLCGVAASVVAYGTSLVTPKYFYYLVPFALLPALHLVDAWRPWLRQRPLLAALLAGVLLIGDGLLGLRTMQSAQRFFTTAPTWATVAEVSTSTRTFALVVGPGELLFNSDGFRVRTGQFFAPWCWHREKQKVQADLSTLRSWLASGVTQTVYWANWLPVQVAVRELLAGGFRPDEQSAPPIAGANGVIWRRQGQTVRLAYLGYAISPYQPPGLAPASTTGADTYFIGDSANQPMTELDDGRHWHLLSAVPEGFITLYQRR